MSLFRESFGQSADPEAVHFPYIGLMALLIALLAANILQSVSLLNQRSNLVQLEKRMDTVVPEARVVQGQIEPRLEALSRDLVQLATTNESARALVNQFGISWNPGAAQTNAAPATSPSANSDPKARGR